MKRHTLLLLLAAISSTGAMGQINCASGSASQKLVCEFPFATGLFTNDTALGGNGAGNGTTSALQLASSINIGIATQVSQLPLASASAGTVVLYKAGVPETYNNLGPILTDRANTVGKHRLFVGFTASQFVFTDIDGTSLKSLPFAYVATAYNPTTGGVISSTYTTENTKLNFKIDQFIGVVTYGLTDKVDATVVVPIEYVSLGATTGNSESYIVNSSNVLVFGPYTSAPTFTKGTASGLGDITVNTKAEFWRGEHATVAAGFNFRVPTGDDLNYLGSGAWGFNPYVVYSRLAKISPHAKLGYQWNTKTELNNPTYTPGGDISLPGGMQYDVGADWALNRRMTFAGDLLGNQYLNTPRLVKATTTINTTSSSIVLPTSVSGNTSYTINNLSLGLKFNPFRNFVISGNVLVQVNNNGLRSRPTPLVGLSYKF